MLTVADIMTANPVRVSPATPLQEVIGLMKSHAYRQILVIDGEELMGIVTDRDIRLAMNSPFVLHDRSQDRALLHDLPAEACMTRNPITVTPETSASQAAQLLRDHKFGSLPVIDRGRVVGIVSISDILDSYIDLLAEVGAQAL